MALSKYALVKATELKDYLGAKGEAQNANLDAAINIATAMIETRLRRQLVSRGDLTEYHTLERWDYKSALYVGEWPIITVTTVHEDTTRTYGASALLTVNTDYIISKPVGKLERVSAGTGGLFWATGYRAEKVVYSGGYKSTEGLPAGADPVPDDLRQACLYIAASIFKEGDRGRWGVSAVTDSLGNTTRFLGYVTPAIEAMLRPYARLEFGRTWERDA